MDEALCDIIVSVISGELKSGDNDESISQIECIQKACQELTYPDFHLLYHRCAYLYFYSLSTCSAVAHHFQEVLEQDPVLKKRLLHRRQLNICCLGGGAGLEAVSIVETLDGMSENRGFHVEVTVVDVVKNWKNAAAMVERIMAHDRDSRFSMSFIFADLSDELRPDVAEAIQKADVVTTVRLMSFMGRMSKDQKKRIKTNVFKNLSVGSCFLFMDSKTGGHIEKMQEASRHFDNLRCTYGPVVGDMHSVSESALAKHKEIHSKIYANGEYEIEETWEHSVLALTIVNDTGRRKSFKKDERKQGRVPSM